MPNLPKIWWCIPIFLLNGSVAPGIEWTATRLQPITPLSVISFMFIFAAGFAAIAALLESRTAAETAHTASGAGRGTAVLLILVAIAAAIGFPSTSIANATALGASRNSFIDYALVPVLAFVAGHLFDSKSTLSWSTLLGFLGCLIGCILILVSLEEAAPSGPIWPAGWSYGGSVTLGIGCAAASASCGVLSLLLVRRLSQSVSPARILFVRLLPCGPAVMLVSWYRGFDWIIGLNGYLVAAALAAALFLALYLLYALLKRETVVAIAPFLFLIPLFTFLLTLFPFRLRQPGDVPWSEWLAMLVIIGSLALIEIGNIRRSER